MSSTERRFNALVWEIAQEYAAIVREDWAWYARDFATILEPGASCLPTTRALELVDEILLVAPRAEVRITGTNGGTCLLVFLSVLYSMGLLVAGWVAAGR